MMHPLFCPPPGGSLGPVDFHYFFFFFGRTIPRPNPSDPFPLSRPVRYPGVVPPAKCSTGAGGPGGGGIIGGSIRDGGKVGEEGRACVVCEGRGRSSTPTERCVLMPFSVYVPLPFFPVLDSLA